MDSYAYYNGKFGKNTQLHPIYGRKAARNRGKRADLLNGLACEGWGIIAASCILLLIQINKQLERIRFEAAKNTSVQLPQAKTKAKPAQKETTPAQAQPVHTPRQIYPNSPIPGGGRVPLQQPVPAPGAKLPPRKEEPEKLSYFKVD